jgi:hypothetical protein
VADIPVGYYDPPTADRILKAVQWLERSGFMSGKGFKPQFNPPTPRPIHIKNLTGEIVPMFGCVQATGTSMMNDQCFLEVKKPADTDGTAGPFFFNLFHDIPAADVPSANEFQYGLATDGPHSNALCDIDEPAGTKLIPIVGSFLLEKGEGAFIQIGPNDGEFMPTNAQRIMTAEPLGAHIIQFVLGSCATGNATITEVLCGHGRPVPGEDNGCVTVVDTMGCLDLVDGLVGWAAWVTTGTGPCYWSIFSLCCPEPEEV